MPVVYKVLPMCLELSVTYVSGSYPLNGGMNSTIPLLGGVPFCGGEGAFQFFLIILRKNFKEKDKGWDCHVAMLLTTTF